MKRYLISLLVLSLFFVFPLLTVASDLNLEIGLQKTLEKSRTVLDQIKKKVSDGQPIASELTLLSTLEDEIKASHLLLQERFRMREEEVKAHGARALKRHQEMSEGYSRHAFSGALLSYLKGSFLKTY
jgi:hypothetical protein